MEMETSNAIDWRRQLAGGIILLVCVAGALVVSLRYASSAWSSWNLASALVIAQPFAFLAIWFPSLRFARLAGSPATPGASFWANALSILLSLITPGRLFEAAKPVVLNLETKLPLARGFVAVALERLLDVGCLALLAAFAVAGAAAQYAEGLRQAALVLAALLGIGVVLVFTLATWPNFAGRIVNALPFRRLRSVANQMVDTFGRAGNWRMLVVSVLYSLLAWMSSYLTVLVLLGVAGAIPLSLEQVLFVFVAGTLGLVVTVTPGGLGTYEGAIVLALGSFGYPLADAVVLALLLRIAVTLPAAAAGAWYLARGGFRLADLIARLRTRRDKR